MHTRVAHEISLGKIAYYGSRKIHEVTIEIAIYYNDDGTYQFTASGNIWNGSRTDIISAGQNLDEILKYIHLLNHQSLFLEIYSYWMKYHLKPTPLPVIQRIEKIIEGDKSESFESRRQRIVLCFEQEVYWFKK
jgi:hypothetical protein